MIWPRKAAAKLTLPPVKLEAVRVIVRPPHLSDSAQWIKVRRRNESFLKPYEPTWMENCLTEDFFKRRLMQQVRDWQRGRSHSFLIFKKEDNVLIGGVNINNVSRGASQYATLGYWIDEQEQGVGYMAEALRLVIDFGFKSLKLHRFNAGCLKDNERSAKLLLKLGFEEEGFAKKYVQIDGKWQDHRLFGLPMEHWQSGHQDNDPAEQADQDT